MEEVIKVFGALAGQYAAAIYVLKKLYPDLLQPGIKKIGDRLATSIELSTLKGKLESEKAKMLMRKHLDDFEKKINDIAEEDSCEVNPQIGVPVLERLSYTTNEEIADLFTSLLAKASSLRTINEAHPGFIKTLENLSVDEARVILYLKKEIVDPSVDLIISITIDGITKVKPIFRNLSKLTKEIGLLFPDDIDFYFDNLTKLGILETFNDYSDVYKKHLESPAKVPNPTMRFVRTTVDVVAEVSDTGYWVSGYGEKFIRACTS